MAYSYFYVVLIEAFAYTLALYIVYEKTIRYSKHAIPLHVLVFMLTYLTPQYLSFSFEALAVFLASLAMLAPATYHSVQRTRGAIVASLLYSSHYFMQIAIPYITTSCTTLSKTCLEIYTANYLQTFLLVFAGFALYTLTTTALYSIRERTLLVSVFALSAYYYTTYFAVLRYAIPQPVLAVLVIVASTATLYLGLKLGSILFSNLPLDKLFDKYVTVNATATLLSILVATLYSARV